MRCAGCGAENEPARRFCAGCGTRLPAPCATCGFVNAASARFCGGCGAALGEAAPASEGQRRQVTVLFADLCGYTSLSTRADPEQVQALLDRLFEILDGVVVAFGGSVNQHLGDGVLALFGAPVAHDNDAERAVAAALAMHRAVAGLQDPQGRQIALHIGVASGLVVAAPTGSREHRSYTVTGDSVNLAARLTDLASAGETLVAEAVRAALGPRLRASLRGDVVPKGLDRPVSVWRVEELAEAAAADGALVGREMELGQLAAALSLALERSSGMVLHLRGEAGIGKTRLVRELLATAADRGMAAHVATVLDFGVERGRDAVRQLAASLLSLARNAASGERAAAVDRAIAAGRVAPEQAPLLFDLLDVPPPPEDGRAIDAMGEATRRTRRDLALASLVEAACAAGPTLIVVEDLHWADPPTVDMLGRLAALTARMPLVLALTSRIEGDPLDAGWRARLEGARLLTLDLGPLQAAEALRLASGLAVGEGGFVRRCVERAAGNPLFLEQLLHHGEDSAGPVVPASIQSLVLARLDRLGGADRAALQAASVLGQRFSAAALRHLLGDPTYACDRLVARHLLQPDGDAFLFRHALIRDGAYEALLGPKRRELHARAAAWFADHDPVLHAEHLDRAGSPAAPQALAAAARFELAAYRAEQALALAERGRALAATAVDRSELGRLEGRILLDLGRAPAAHDAYAAALGAASGEAAACRARIGLAGAMRLSDRLDEAMAELDAAEPVATKRGLLPELAMLHSLRGNLHFAAGRSEECRHEHELALQAAEGAAEPELIARALGGLGDAAYAQGRWRTALDSFGRCVLMAQAHGLGRIEVANRAMVPICRCLAGPMGDAGSEAAAAVATARQVGQQRAEIIACHAGYISTAWQLDLDRAHRHLDRADELTARVGARRFHAENLAFRAQMEHLAGRHDNAQRLGAEALEDVRTAAPGFIGAMVAGIYAAIAPPAQLSAVLAEGERMLALSGLGHNHLFFLQGGIEAMLRVGDWNAAEAFAAGLEARFSAEPTPLVDLVIRRGQLHAACGRGEVASAGQAIERLAAEATELGYPILALRPGETLAG
jgi:class 3 adenylate cyclase/tetratricopeptide (TPR) repeat protein